jgi:hypothetical protein
MPWSHDEQRKMVQTDKLYITPIRDDGARE